MGISFRSTTLNNISPDLKQQITYRNIKCVKFSNSHATHLNYHTLDRQTDLIHRHQEHISYIKESDSKWAYALHILNNNHEYASICTTMSLLKQITETSLLIPNEEFCVYSHYHHKERIHKELIPEKYRSENNPMYQLILDPIKRHHLQYSLISTPTEPLPTP